MLTLERLDGRRRRRAALARADARRDRRSPSRSALFALAAARLARRGRGDSSPGSPRARRASRSCSPRPSLPVPFLLWRTGWSWSLPAGATGAGARRASRRPGPLIAGQLRGIWTRAALGALGAWWLLLAEPLLDERLLLGFGARGDAFPDPAAWRDSPVDAWERVLAAAAHRRRRSPSARSGRSPPRCCRSSCAGATRRSTWSPRRAGRSGSAWPRARVAEAAGVPDPRGLSSRARSSRASGAVVARALRS